MGNRRTYRLVLAGAAAAGLLAVGYGTAYGTAEDSRGEARRSGETQPVQQKAASGDYESALTLSDGRKVHVRLVEGTGVQERHRSADSSRWSKWQTLYKTESDRCQGVDLAEKDGTVTLIADFGLYCSDGEPPQESVAAVGTGELTDWDTDLAEGFDGWESTSISDEGSRVAFVRNSDSGLYSLRWELGEGFSEMEGPED